MALPLQVFNVSLYATPAECDDVPYQCIAPTARRTRCQWHISDDNLSEATALREQAQNLPDGPERNRVISRYILFHCCTKQHRWRLEADRTGTLTQLTTWYAANMGVIRIPTVEPVMRQPTPPPPSPPQIQSSPMTGSGSTASTSQDNALRTPSPRAYSLSAEQSDTSQMSIVPDRVQQALDDLAARNAELEEQLRSAQKERDAYLEEIQQSNKKELQKFRRQEKQLQEADNPRYFIPYVTDPRMSVRDLLMEDVDFDWAKTGEVYCFVWPTHSRFVKIGYTSASADGRVDEWQSCNPGAKLSWSAKVAYPERIERLIHLQMARYRYKIAQCSNADCRRSHEEWFRLPVDTVNQIINEWAMLMERDPLYDARRKLTARWHRRINDMEDEVTARNLLALLDDEEREQREIEESLVNLSLGPSYAPDAATAAYKSKDKAGTAPRMKLRSSIRRNGGQASGSGRGTEKEQDEIVTKPDTTPSAKQTVTTVVTTTSEPSSSTSSLPFSVKARSVLSRYGLRSSLSPTPTLQKK